MPAQGPPFVKYAHQMSAEAAAVHKIRLKRLRTDGIISLLMMNKGE